MRYLQAGTCLIFSPCACQSLLESRRRLWSATPRHPVFLQVPTITQLPKVLGEQPWPPPCWPFPHLALGSPGVCDVLQLTSAGISLVISPSLGQVSPRQEHFHYPSAKVWHHLNAAEAFILPFLHLPPPLLALPGQIFWLCVSQVLESSHQCCH